MSRFKLHRKPPTLKKGPLKPSRRVLRRYRATESLRGAVKAYKDTIAAGYRAKLESELRDGETLPDQVLALELAERSVETVRADLERAERVYRRQVSRRRSLHGACDRLAREELYPELVAVRAEIDLRFGRDAGRGVHGMQGSTRRKPGRMLPQLEHAVAQLAELETMPEAQRPGPAGERRDWLSRLQPGCEKLQKMLGDLRGEEIREAALRDDRDYEIESFDVVYAEAVGYARAVCRLAGLDPKLIRNLLSDVEQRRLKKKARKESEARAEGQRG